MATPMTTCASLPDARQARLDLIQAALHAFAKHGINGVSLRTIVSNSGQQNQSAIHYHFKNKQGLVVAVLDYVSEMLAPEMESSLLEFSKQPLSIWTPHLLTELICRPFISLDGNGGDGHIAIKFMSRLTWQEGDQGQTLLVRAIQPYFQSFSEAIFTLNPTKPIDMQTFQIYLAVNTLIHGLADSSLLTRSPTMGVEEIRRDKPGQMMHYFLAYIAGGLFTPLDKSSIQ
jgi:AcrR family transcriptional regulator